MLLAFSNMQDHKIWHCFRKLLKIKNNEQIYLLTWLIWAVGRENYSLWWLVIVQKCFHLDHSYKLSKLKDIQNSKFKLVSLSSVYLANAYTLKEQTYSSIYTKLQIYMWSKYEQEHVGKSRNDKIWYTGNPRIQLPDVNFFSKKCNLIPQSYD